MMPSSASATLTDPHVVALLSGQFVFRQMRHADDAVHGSADFMAHVGQEIGFDLGGFFGHLFGSTQFFSQSSRA